MKYYPGPSLLAKVRLSLEASELLIIVYHSYFLSAVILALTPGFGPYNNTVKDVPRTIFFRQQRGAVSVQ